MPPTTDAHFALPEERKTSGGYKGLLTATRPELLRSTLTQQPIR
uniref:Uncharacterized protein n=1 Tax=Utricularia reniformis TaxID=192314 RepID=A0A1Y0B4B9_9LAMI|nr:hypothetical protein AEK19_MT2078 [Utricularia reniformis]ART32233.1 hypothetical protein AEK19_MT2078 [Utricularia reniformis]